MAVPIRGSTKCGAPFAFHTGQKNGLDLQCAGIKPLVEFTPEEELMKRLIVAALAVVMLVSVAPQPAQSNMGVFATWWDAKDMESGFGAGVKYGFPIIPIVSIDARASYIKFSEDDISVYTIPLEAVGTLSFGLIYGGVALGYYIWGGADESTSNRVGGSLLAGVSFGLGGIGAFGEVKYNIVKTTVADVFEAKADGISVNLGVTF